MESQLPASASSSFSFSIFPWMRELVSLLSCCFAAARFEHGAPQPVASGLCMEYSTRLRRAWQTRRMYQILGLVGGTGKGCEGLGEGQQINATKRASCCCHSSTFSSRPTVLIMVPGHRDHPSASRPSSTVGRQRSRAQTCVPVSPSAHVSSRCSPPAPARLPHSGRRLRISGGNPPQAVP